MSDKDQAVVILDEPIQRGKTEIKEVVIRKPNSGTLRGVRLVALMEMDVDSMMVILPRITIPALTKQEIIVMAPGDLISMAGEVVSFLLPNSVRTDSQTS